MKKHYQLFLLAILLVLVASCQEKKTSRSTSSSTNTLNCSGNNFFTLPGCTGFCQHNPTSPACSTNPNVALPPGTTPTPTPPSPGGTTSCLINPYSYQCYCATYPQATGCPSGVGAINANWGVMYPPTGSAPDNSQSSCSTQNPSGVDQAYDVRKATVTVTGGQWYNPTNASELLNTSSTLKSVSSAISFFQTDSMLKVRFKVKPQPHAANTSDTCHGRTRSQSYIAGYYKLKFNLKLVGKRSDNTIGEEFLGIIEGNVNSCTSGIDLSNYTGMYPNGIYLVISDVQSNQGSWPNNYSTYGFRDSNTWSTVRSSDCWTMDIEVAADGTKTFE
jgi:hypothetical protein